MHALKSDHVTSSPSRYAWQKVQGLEKLIIRPVPTPDDLDYYGYSPQELNARGCETPLNDCDALAFATDLFMKSEEYKEWCGKFTPELTTLWPCNPAVPLDQAATAIHNEGLQCVLVKGVINGITEVSGIAILPGDKGEVSDHLAAAYICCGQLPPSSLMPMALSRRNPAMKEELREVAPIIRSYLARLGNNIDNKSKEMPFTSISTRGP